MADSSPIKASIVLPTYDERGNIVRLIEALRKEVPAPLEIIVVDDNSPDGTSQAVSEYIAAHPGEETRIETRYTDRGLTNSISRGIELSTGDIICWMDCDFSHPPADMAKLVSLVREGKAEIAVASRYITGGQYKSGLKWFGADETAMGVLLSRLINWFIRVALDPRFHDYTSGFIAVRATTLRSLMPLYGDYGEYFMDLMYRAIKKGHTFLEIPFVSPPRTYGVSKTGTSFRQLFRRGVKYIRVIGRLWHVK